MKKRKRTFTCPKCHKRTTFDSDEIKRQTRSLMERVGDKSEIVAYHPECAHCGEEVRVPTRKGRSGLSKNGGRIEMSPKVMLGKPVFSGTRIPVELVLRKLSEGATEAQLLDAYPRLKSEDLRAALAFAADTIAHEESVAV